MHDKIVVRALEIPGEQCLAAELEVYDLGDADIDNAEEALVALLELLLVEDLDGDDGRVSDGDVKRVVPVGVERLFDHRGGVCLLAVDGDNRKRVWEAKDIALSAGTHFRQAICGHYCDAHFPCAC